jgi:periplasmic protein CpxP/Spy
MSKIKLLSIISIVLLISNLSLIGYLIMQKGKPPKGEGPRNMIIEKLGFDESQIKAYDNLIEWHRSEVRKTDEQILSVKNELYSHLNNDSDSSICDSLISEIGSLQIHIEKIHLKHFKEIEKICKKEQIPAYEKLTGELAKLFSIGKPKPPKH